MPLPTPQHPSFTLLDPDKHTAVALDHLPRVARYADEQGVESRKVLYWTGRRVETLLEAEWLNTRGPLPTDPTPEQIAAALAARQQDTQDTAALRQAIRTRLDALAGKRVDDLLVGELKTLLLYLVCREGGVDKDMRMRAPGDWGR